MLEYVVEDDGVGDSYRIGTFEEAMPHLQAMRATERNPIDAGLQPDVSVPIVASKNLRQAAQPAPISTTL